MNKSTALREVCCELFAHDVCPDTFPFDFWCANYPLPVIIYALLEAQGKCERTPEMTHRQIVNFVTVVMERKDSDEKRKQQSPQ